VSKVEKAVAESAGKGKGAAAKRELNEALMAAGALSVSTTHQLREVKETGDDQE
jgi:hypothetical protein